MWYEIYAKGELMTTVYNEQDIVKESCELVNGYGYNPDDIEVVTKGR